MKQLFLQIGEKSEVTSTNFELCLGWLDPRGQSFTKDSIVLNYDDRYH